MESSLSRYTLFLEAEYWDIGLTSDRGHISTHRYDQVTCTLYPQRIPPAAKSQEWHRSGVRRRKEKMSAFENDDPTEDL